jgi:hypothetical protein
MRYVPLLASLLACAAGSSPHEPWNRPVDCPRVAAVVRADDQADSVWNTALLSLYDCPEEAGRVLGDLWLDSPQDSLQQRRVHAISGDVSDRDLFNAVAHVLADTGRPTWHRLDALGVFVQWADSTAVLGLSQEPWRAPNGEIVSVTPTIGHVPPAHTQRRAGRLPLGQEERKQILGLVRRVAEQDPTISVRVVAQYVDGWLGGLPPRAGWR